MAAKMYPAKFPHEEIDENDNGLLAEEYVYNLLKAEGTLPDNWVVMYNQWRYYISNTNNHEKYENYEADFFVLVPGKGIAVLEVKSWYQPRINNGRWEHKVGKNYIPYKKGSPLNQANSAAVALRKELLKSVPVFGSYKLECRPLAILCGTSDNYEKIKFCVEDSEAAKYINKTDEERFRRLYVVGYDALNNIRQQIENLFVCNNEFTDGQIRLVCEHLLHNVRFKSDPATCVAMMNVASAGLDSILPRLERSRKGIHVSGCAGSGKTWMACNEVIRLHQKHEEKKILFLCYNRNLADYVSGCLLQSVGATEVDGDSSVQVSTFHSLCRQLCSSCGIRFFLGEDGEIPVEVLKRIREYVRREIKYRYDYIFVDEAQDIRDDWWDYVITEMKKTASSLMYVFSDSNQLIYKEGQEVISLPVRVTLKNNLRNAFDICQLSTAALPEEEQDIIPLPLKSDNCICSKGFNSTEERARQVETYIEQILSDNNGITKKDIVVLSPYVKDSSFNYLDDVVAGPVEKETPEDAKKRMQDCFSEADNRVLGETVRSFKGLEAPFVILTDIGEPKKETKGFTPNDFYVACTRAKYGLYIVPTVAGEKYIRKLETAAANLPSPLEI